MADILYGSRPQPVPVTVRAAAGLFALHALWLLVSDALPAFAAGDPEALSALINVGLTVGLVIGLLSLRRWAWWLASIASGAGWMIPLALLGAFETIRAGAELADPEGLVRALTVVGVLSFAAFSLLVTPSSRRAF